MRRFHVHVILSRCSVVAQYSSQLPCYPSWRKLSPVSDTKQGGSCEIKMQGNGGNTCHVPWSRHMAITPKSVRQPGNPEDFIGGRGCHPIKKKQAKSEIVSGKSVKSNRRRVKSESSYLDGDKMDVDEESWDSQSDPGSSCPTKWKGYSSKLSNTSHDEQLENEGSSSDRGIARLEGKKSKSFIQGMGGSQQNVVRKRKMGQADLVKGIRRNGDFVVGMPSSRDADVGAESPSYHHLTSPRYDHMYDDFMYYACLNPRKLWSTKTEGDMEKTKYFLDLIQKIIFCYISIMAAFTSFNYMKYYVLAFLVNRTLNNFIDIGYFVVSGVFQMYAVYFLAFDKQQKQASNPSQNRDDCEAGAEMGGMRSPPVEIKHKVMQWLPILNGIVTLVMAAIKSMSWLPSFENTILICSVDTVEGLFLWTPEDFDNKTSIIKYYIADRTSIAFYAMGIFGFISDFCWKLIADSSKDLIFWVAMVHAHRISVFRKKIKENLATKSASGESSSESDDEQCWEMYRDLVAVNMSTNKTYHMLLVLNHLDTFLTFSYFLTLFLKDEKDSSMSELIYTGYDVLKGLLVYIPARRAALVNEECRRWIQTLPCETKRFRAEGGTVLSRDVMLWELKEEPLGLGNGKIHINNEFLVSFITLVASLFCFLLNLKKKDKDPKQYYF